MTTESLHDTTARNVANILFKALKSHRKASDIDAAFAAVKVIAPVVYYRALDYIEDGLIKRATDIRALQEEHEYSLYVPYQNGPAVAARQAEIMGDIEEANPVGIARALVRLAQIKGNKAQALTKILARAVSELPPADQNAADKIALCFYDTPAAAADNKKPTLADIGFYLSNLGAPAAIAALKACDDNLREDLIDRCEQQLIVNARETADKVAAGKYKEIPHSWAAPAGDSLAFMQHIVAAKGAGADPLLRAYVEGLVLLPLAQHSDGPSLATIFNNAVSKVAIDACHTAARTKQDRLRELAAQRRARFGK